jgi:PAS domain-containing protein
MHDTATMDQRIPKLLEETLQHQTGVQQDADRLRMLQEAIDCLPVQAGITISDLNGKIIYANEVEAEMHGYAHGELVGQDARVLAPGYPELPFLEAGVPECPQRRRGISGATLLDPGPQWAGEMHRGHHRL